MVTFALPGDSDAADASRGTPRARPPLPFAQRAYAASPYGSARGTPRGASARKQLLTRDDVPASSLNNNSIAAARNIFRASSIVDSPPAASTFSPSIPQSTKKMLFAPGSTPDPSRIYRESTAQATPRGIASKEFTKELFPMKISEPPVELSGEALTRKVPKDWSSKSSIYADQYLAHLCPPEFDDEQRRQFFCILDLRRLKYAADEIFIKKGWKLNITNFAKEFDKSRSIILLRYGLYEFQNVKPSKDVVKRWRREHGLPDLEDDGTDATPTKPAASKKRKGGDDLTKESAVSDGSANKAKRRATERDERDERDEQEAAPDAAFVNKNKRKAYVSDETDEQPSKLQKSTPSKAKSLFEKIASKPATPATSTPAKPNPFAAKPTNGSLARSVFSNVKPGGQSAPAGNIFGHLSDASSAKNSGVEGDVDSETSSDGEEAQDAEQQSDVASVAPSVATDSTQFGSSLFGKKPAPTSAPVKDAAGSIETREGTPGRSLFDRVTKASNGEPARVDLPSAEVSTPADKTWNPSTTPLKFAPSAPTPQAGTLFGKAAVPSSSLFAQKSATGSLPGASKPDQPAVNGSSAEASGADKDGDESDKENDSQAPNKSASEGKAATPQPSFGSSSLFQTKPATSDAPQGTEPPKLSFGATSSAAPGSSSLVGSTTKSASPPVVQPSPLFGAKQSEPKEQPAAEPPKPSQGLFGTGAGTPKTLGADTTSTLFGAKPSGSAPTLFGNVSAPKSLENASSGSTPAGGLFGSGSEAIKAAATDKPSSLFGANGGNAPGLFGNGAAPLKPLFGGLGSGNNSAAATPTLSSTPAPTAKQQPPAPTFSFGSSSSTGDKPAAPAQPAPISLFGAPKSPPSITAPTGSLFSGSPMKQDEPSPAKRAFNGGSNGGSSAPKLNFGTTAAPGGMFGGSSTPAPTGSATGSINFGGTSSTANTGSGGFNFQFGSGGAAATASTGTAFNNPFASGVGGNNAGAASTSAPGSLFNFGGASAPGTGGSTSFQFGGANGASSTPAGGSLFGGQASNPTPSFGGALTPGGGPSFNFTSASPQPAKAETGSVFASNPNPPFVNLQPPGGGASTTGTNSPFSFGGGSSLATTPANGTPEPSSQAERAAGGDGEEGEKHEQINLTEGLEADEESLHEVRAKVLKFVPAGEKSDEDKPKSKSPWSTQGVGPLRLLKHKETGSVRLLLRAEPRGHIAMNRAVLPDMSYKADEKYVKMTTGNETGDGLETWMIQVKTKELARDLAEALEKHKELNKK